MKRPWKKISSKIIHKNPWYSLREDDVIRPDGNKGKYYVVDDTDSIAVIAENADGEIYLVGQTRYSIDNYYSWEIITGGAKKSANSLEIAKQELQEEAGILADNWIELGYVCPITGLSSEKCFIYLAKNLKFVKNDLEPTEDISIRKEKLENIIKMIKNNKIVCGITIAAIYKYLLHKKL